MKNTFTKPITLLAISLLVCANPAFAAQTCKTSIIQTAPTSRFTVNGDGSVTDKQTGLIWAQCRQGLSGSACTAIDGATMYAWSAALEINRPTSAPSSPTDWRLPNIKELVSLVETACFSPAINETVFPNTGAGFFWSASPSADYAGDAWGVGFSNGFTTFGDRGSEQAVRLVRGGQ